MLRFTCFANWCHPISRWKRSILNSQQLIRSFTQYEVSSGLIPSALSQSRLEMVWLPVGHSGRGALRMRINVTGRALNPGTLAETTLLTHMLSPNMCRVSFIKVMRWSGAQAVTCLEPMTTAHRKSCSRVITNHTHHKSPQKVEGKEVFTSFYCDINLLEAVNTELSRFSLLLPSIFSGGSGHENRLARQLCQFTWTLLAFTKLLMLNEL